MKEEAIILNGQLVAKSIKETLLSRIGRLKTCGIIPCLVTILVGNDPASETYVQMKGSACRRLGMDSKNVTLPADTTTEELLGVIRDLEDDPQVHGILLQHPVPSQIDERAAFDAIPLNKDVDGVSCLGFGRTAFDLECFASCTPKAIITILDYYGISIEGKHAVVIGRSPILGKPISLMLLNRNATVTVCHSKTENLPHFVKQADVVVAAVGKPKLVQGDWIKPGAVVMDAGYNPGNIGDVDYAACVKKAGAITPVPGGIGPVTIATLLKHTVDAAEKDILDRDVP